ncbi:hypothetical protein C3941_10650 [Kaistia algarum]|uniref:hypothetical protein n=1 Tax=Kaistia algarum TaxID=2083279 RepID=UPI000CE76F4C|nr:hypothetical protein [Kaistia algarum]MCX5514807.1 hypothetical protein [Kaistia algarum]PPE79570.1 hypothetical protein C3941_10650 [Kaistia algarum]
MAGYLVAERVIELAPEGEDGAGHLARYALYAAAAAAALAGAWLIAAPSSGSAPAPGAMTARTAELPVAAEMPASNIRQIDMSKAAAQDGGVDSASTAAGPTAYSAPSVPAAPAPAAAMAEMSIPPKPVPRPTNVTVRQAPVIAAEPAARIAAPAMPAAEPAPRMVQTGAPPQDLGVLRDAAAPSYAAPVYVPAQPPAVAYEPSGPVPPMPVEDAAATAAPAGTPVHHQGLLGASERAVGTAWNWTTGTVGGVVRGVQQSF